MCNELEVIGLRLSVQDFDSKDRRVLQSVQNHIVTKMGPRITPNFRFGRPGVKYLNSLCKLEKMC